jgi:hypothetical protein
MQIFYFTLEDCNNEIETGCCFFQGRIEMVIRKKTLTNGLEPGHGKHSKGNG